ncbi:MurR/RpiR family transcriptional regulator [Streptomyces somaliensis DSM 40738]|uniref:MurR/RpiR family transcriptional regulator n=1 Tax=Streptomyces somaliensis (strain ATCC 33201 / DSM 40738 / JCM 12659 / KCTC 9044 / NCTC 11332 / NRRL B-12077 / IP 733) TaxID=1134445 RepID=A0AA44DC39_STRE0|nr:MurR/RpiR family transcriptional regulator [Streptomyces somaliensis]MCQ0021586.1 MurR/RpiR family transcriptional regulator [Streptomyces somaliensis DSM 40738]NKY14128.1 MurR/RpiR family transcriptional regulator [Streptomyces somaliensis DSM 40738]
MEPLVTRLGEIYSELPPGERAVVRVLLDDYPFAALGSLRALANRAGVSPPTASRLVGRLGFGGFAEFQGAVRAAARERDHSRLHEFVTQRPDTHRAAEDLRTGMEGALATATEPLLATTAACLAEAGGVWALGGPLSELAAEYLIRQLAGLRAGAHRVPDSPPARARTLLDMGPSDVVVAYDFRRYSADTARYVHAARSRGARLVLVTDAWESPLADQAEVLIRLPREAAGPIAPLTHEIAITELILVATASRLAPASRLADLDALAHDLMPPAS